MGRLPLERLRWARALGPGPPSSRDRPTREPQVDSAEQTLGSEEDQADQERPKNLPYGDQKRVEIARALAAEPRLLLLDEPAAGMSTGEASELMALIRRFRAEGLTVLLLEHHLRVVMEVSDRVPVLDHGELIAVGGPESVRRDPAVIAAYLGGRDA